MFESPVKQSLSQSPGAKFSKLLWKLLRKNLGKCVGKHSPSPTWRKLCNRMKFAKKYAMLTLSLDVICDVIGYLRNAAVKSTMSK